MMTPRERVRKALNREEPDRVPVDFGQDFHNGINEVAYQNLRAYLQMDTSAPIRIYDLMQRLAVVDERILERFHVDTRYIMANPNENWTQEIEADGSFEDEWGVYRKRCGYYCENVRSPLAGKSLEEISRFPFPDPAEKSRFRGLREKAQRLYETTPYALMAGQAASLYYFSAELRGFEEYMGDLVQEPRLISLLLDRVLEWMMEFTSHYLDAIGDYIEGWWMGDDWGMQTGPIMSPHTFRAVFKPRYQRLIDLVKSKTKAKVCLHTCGATFWILQDLVDVGVDVVHPLQPTALGNEDPARIKQAFGDRLAFYSNVANTTILPNGTPQDVVAEVQRKIAALAPGGGYIFSGGHNIQADVPPANIVALFDTAYEAGRYPLADRA
ncbi:MAG: uroporphyrinogen decarboxylase family protein [Terriglobia bacterium]|jgi:uroporphyrinogen decarboxylase